MREMVMDATTIPGGMSFDTAIGAGSVLFGEGGA